jgi:hypothetical protein
MGIKVDLLGEWLRLYLSRSLARLLLWLSRRLFGPKTIRDVASNGNTTKLQ